MKGVYIINTESNLEIGGKVYYLSTNIPSKQSDGSYTNDDYAQAYANGQIIAAEIAKAYEQGYSSVKIANGTYSLCAIYKSAHYPDYCVGLEDIHNMEIDFDGASFKSIYDSNRYNPYCSVTSEPSYKQRILPIGLTRCTNIKISNLELIGDAYERSWVRGEERMEQTYGISIGQLCRDISIENYCGRGFMGDAIRGMAGAYPYMNVRFTSWNVDKSIDANGNVVDSTPSEDDKHYLVSDLLDLDSAYNSESSVYPYQGTIRDYVSKNSIKGFETKVQFRAPASSYTYQKNEYGWKVALYKKVGTGYAFQKLIDADIFNIIDISQYDALRLEFSNEYVENVVDGKINKDFKIILSQVLSHNILINQCRISDGHRGGMSNMPHNTTIRKTFVYNCGQDCGVGAPLFPDSTRYGYDQEEQYCDSVKIEQCKFEGCPISVLMNAEICSISGTRFREGGVSANAIRNMTIKDCVFNGCGVSSGSNQAGWRGGEEMRSTLAVYNCSFTDKEFWIYDVQRRTIIIESSRIFAQGLRLTNNEDLRIVNSHINLIGKNDFYDNYVNGVHFENSTITGCSTNKGFMLNDVKGSLIISNAYPRFHPFNTDSIVIKGVHFDENVQIMDYNVSKVASTFIDKCQFDCVCPILYNNALTTQTATIKNSEFTLSEKPLKVMAWQDLTSKTFSVNLLHCDFKCAENALFDKYGASATLALKAIGCIFGDY